MTPSTATTHYIKARATGAKQWQYITRWGGLNRLRVHAGEYTEEEAIRKAATVRSGWEFRAVAMPKPKDGAP